MKCNHSKYKTFIRCKQIMRKCLKCGQFVPIKGKQMIKRLVDGPIKFNYEYYGSPPPPES